jgi:hypothetical protein
MVWYSRGGLAKFNDTNWVVYDPENSPCPYPDFVDRKKCVIFENQEVK